MGAPRASLESGIGIARLRSAADRRRRGVSGPRRGQPVRTEFANWLGLVQLVALTRRPQKPQAARVPHQLFSRAHTGNNNARTRSTIELASKVMTTTTTGKEEVASDIANKLTFSIVVYPSPHNPLLTFPISISTSSRERRKSITHSLCFALLHCVQVTECLL